MAGALVARAGASFGGASIDEMIMQRPEKAAPAFADKLAAASPRRARLEV